MGRICCNSRWAGAPGPPPPSFPSMAATGNSVSPVYLLLSHPTDGALGDDYLGSDWVSGYCPSVCCAGAGQVDKLG
jgi:hypothetical protein